MSGHVRENAARDEDKNVHYTVNVRVQDAAAENGEAVADVTDGVSWDGLLMISSMPTNEARMSDPTYFNVHPLL